MKSFSLIIAAILTVVSASYLKTDTLSLNIEDFDYMACGSFSSTCSSLSQEEHIYSGKANGYPTSLEKTITYFSGDSCQSSNLQYTVKLVARVTDASVVIKNKILININYDTVAVSFSVLPTSFDVTCTSTVEVNTSYNVSTLTCTKNGVNLFASLSTVGSVSPATVEFDSESLTYDGGATLSLNSKDKFCVFDDKGDKMMTLMYTILIIVMIVLVVIGCVIVCLCVKDDKKSPKKTLPVEKK